MAYFAYNVGGWVQKEGKMCLRNKSMAPYFTIVILIFLLTRWVTVKGYRLDSNFKNNK